MTSIFQHKEAAAGGWQKFSIMEQLGNIGSEVSRANNWQGKNRETFWNAVERALELFDLTLEDPRWHGARLQEIALVREVFCDAIYDGNLYKSSLEELERYFFNFIKNFFSINI